MATVATATADDGENQPPVGRGDGGAGPLSPSPPDDSQPAQASADSTETVTLSGQLTGNFSTDVGRVRIGEPANRRLIPAADGSFEAEVPYGESFNIAYIQTDSTDGLVNFNGNPDTYYLKRLENLTDDRDLGTFSIPSGNRLNIQFVDETGTPLDGIRAAVRSLSTSGIYWWQIFTSTNSQGFYSTENSIPGIEVVGDVELAALGDADDTRVPDVAATKQFTVTSDRTETITVNPITATGEVIRPDGTALSGDNISVFVATDSFAETATDGNGSFQVQLPRNSEFATGAYQIQYYRSGLIDSDVDVPASDQVDIYAGPQLIGTRDEAVGTLTIPDGNRVEVQVTDADGVPVENATVEYRHRNQTTDTRAAFSVSTDATGAATTNGRSGLVLPENITVLVTPPDHTDRLLDTEIRREATVTAPITIDVELPFAPTLSTYTNDTGVVDDAGLFQAIADWRDDKINESLLTDVVVAWREE